MKRVVIAGNGMVGQRFVELLRERDTRSAWQITVFGEESRPAYDRVALSSWFTGATESDLGLASAGCYDGEQAVLHLTETVVSIDRDQHTVTTSTGRQTGYDALVLATGSTAFVPPIPGRDAAGCFVYRTLDDLAAIRDHSVGRRTGVVIGGGLLGLEAANALRALDLDTHIVELAPRLMPLQVDDGGGEALRRHVEALGLAVHAGIGSKEVLSGPNGVTGVELSDGTQLAADIVVFAAGVRARDDLARQCGLEVGARGGVVVDENCRTADDAVFAIGECACVDGRVYGLVAPGYSMADIVVEQLLGATVNPLGNPDMSTKLKLLGVDVASFGDAHGATEGALDVVLADMAAGVYKKLVLSDDARTLLGGVLVGDASAYAALRPMVGRPLDGEAASWLLPEGAAPSRGSLPDDAAVCSCYNITKGAITNAIVSNGLTDVGAVKSCTKAGTGCGSCVPMLKSLLGECGAVQSKALCEHFEASRPELFDIVRVTGIATFSELISRHGRGRGCDICKPVVASILASIGSGHILDGEQAALQDTNDHFLANIQRNGTYSVVPRIPGGEVTPEKLIVIGEVARDFGLYTKITGGQRIDLLGARVEQLPAIWRRLIEAGFESGHAYGKALRTVKSCVGSTWCRFGVQDSVGLAIALELRYRGLRAPHKIKLGVSGCARECAEARSKDVGVIATESGWNLYVGGNGGFRPRHAELLASDLDTDTLVNYIDRFLMYYVRTADRLQRTAGWIEAMDGGLDQLRRVVVDDALGITDDLEAAMAEHVESYEDEWRGVLDDPDKLRRFASFVNAPDHPDPTIRFVPERGQLRPAMNDDETERPVLIAGPKLEVVPR